MTLPSILMESGPQEFPCGGLSSLIHHRGCYQPPLRRKSRKPPLGGMIIMSFDGITLANAINFQYEFMLKYYSSYGFIKAFIGKFSIPWWLISCVPCPLIFGLVFSAFRLCKQCFCYRVSPCLICGYFC